MLKGVQSGTFGGRGASSVGPELVGSQGRRRGGGGSGGFQVVIVNSDEGFVVCVRDIAALSGIFGVFLLWIVTSSSNVDVGDIGRGIMNVASWPVWVSCSASKAQYIIFVPEYDLFFQICTSFLIRPS